VPTSLFPSISLDAILDYTFDMGRFFHCSPDSFDTMDYFEFMVHYDKVVPILQKKAKQYEQGDEGTVDLSTMVG